MREAWWFGFRDLFLCSRHTRSEMAQLSVKTDSFGRHKHCWKCPPWTSLWFAGTLTADIIYLASYLVNLSQFYLDMSLKLIFKSSVLPNHQKHAESFFKLNIYRFYWELFPSKGTKEKCWQGSFVFQKYKSSFTSILWVLKQILQQQMWSARPDKWEHTSLD